MCDGVHVQAETGLWELILLLPPYWVPGSRFRSSGLVANTLTCWTLLPTQGTISFGVGGGRISLFISIGCLVPQVSFVQTIFSLLLQNMRIWLSYISCSNYSSFYTHTLNTYTRIQHPIKYIRINMYTYTWIHASNIQWYTRIQTDLHVPRLTHVQNRCSLLPFLHLVNRVSPYSS